MDTALWLCPSLPTETLKWLSSLPILMQKSFWWWRCSDRYIWIDDRLYSAIFSALLSRLTALTCGSTWVTSFLYNLIILIARVFFNIHWSGVLTALAWLMPHETAAVMMQVLCTPYNYVPCHFMQSHIHKVYVCLAVTCHLHFWQNDWDLLRATAVTQGWNGYLNKYKNQHRK